MIRTTLIADSIKAEIANMTREEETRKGPQMASIEPSLSGALKAQNPRPSRWDTFYTITFASLIALLICSLHFRTVVNSSVFSSSQEEFIATSASPAARTAFLVKVFQHQADTISKQVAFIKDLISSHKGTKDTSEGLAFAIVSESFRANYDPLLVAAVIGAESTFKFSATSNRGARGLMQIMPQTGRFISKLHNIEWSSDAALHDPATNIRIGIAYLKHLEQIYGGNRERMLVAYNWGPANVDGALINRGKFPDGCLKYARKVLANHQAWQKRFSTELALYNAGKSSMFS